MELWSLMHFLMPKVFSSHSDFREWFSNPLTGMVEGSQEYNDSIVKRLHQVCILHTNFVCGFHDNYQPMALLHNFQFVTVLDVNIFDEGMHTAY